jgi:hypothetical protein
LKDSASPFEIRRSNKEGTYWFAIGRTNFGIVATLSTKTRRIGVELRLDGEETKPAFIQWLGHKESIEAEFGELLEWQESGKKTARIAVYRDADPADESDLAEMHRWMLERMNRFKQVFARRVAAYVEPGEVAERREAAE